MKTLNSGAKVKSRGSYVGFVEAQAPIDHYARIKALWKEHGDAGVKVYVLEVLKEADKRIDAFNATVETDEGFASDDLGPVNKKEEPCKNS